MVSSMKFVTDNLYGTSPYEIPKNLSGDFTNEVLEKLNDISTLFAEVTFVTLFGLDFLYDEEKDIYYILEVNYFPSYRDLGKKLPDEISEHIRRYYEQFKIKLK